MRTLCACKWLLLEDAPRGRKSHVPVKFPPRSCRYKMGQNIESIVSAELVQCIRMWDKQFNRFSWQRVDINIKKKKTVNNLILIRIILCSEFSKMTAQQCAPYFTKAYIGTSYSGQFTLWTWLFYVSDFYSKPGRG